MYLILPIYLILSIYLSTYRWCQNYRTKLGVQKYGKYRTVVLLRILIPRRFGSCSINIFSVLQFLAPWRFLTYTCIILCKSLSGTPEEVIYIYLHYFMYLSGAPEKSDTETRIIERFTQN
jgi:hypothetical protein